MRRMCTALDISLIVHLGCKLISLVIKERLPIATFNFKMRRSGMLLIIHHLMKLYPWEGRKVKLIQMLK